jgi:hypothetical protein
VVAEVARVDGRGKPDLNAKARTGALLELVLGEDLGRDRAQHVEMSTGLGGVKARTTFLIALHLVLGLEAAVANAHALAILVAE